MILDHTGRPMNRDREWLLPAPRQVCYFVQGPTPIVRQRKKKKAAASAK